MSDFFPEGWEALMGLEPCDDIVRPEWLPPDWNIASTYDPSGKKRTKYVSSEGKICKDKSDALRTLGLPPVQSESGPPFDFAPGWELTLGLEPYSNELPPGLPSDWKMAKMARNGERAKFRTVYVSPAGVVIRDRGKAESILGFSLGEVPRSSPSGTLVPFDFAPGWEEELGLEPCPEGAPAGLPLSWKMAQRTDINGIKMRVRKLYVTPEGKVIRDKSIVESTLGISLGETVTSFSSPQHSMDPVDTTAAASATGFQPVEEIELPRVEEIELPSVMISHGFFASTAKSTEELRRQIRLLEEDQAERLLEFLGDDVVATDEGHCVVDLDVLLKPRLIALRDFVARQLSTSPAKRTRVA